MDFKWNKNVEEKLKKNGISKENAEEVIQNSSTVMDISNETIETRTNPNKTYAVIGFTKEGEFSNKPMTVVFETDGTDIVPKSAGQSKEKDKEYFKEHQERTFSNPLREKEINKSLEQEQSRIQEEKTLETKQHFKEKMMSSVSEKSILSQESQEFSKAQQRERDRAALKQKEPDQRSHQHDQERQQSTQPLTKAQQRERDRAELIRQKDATQNSKQQNKSRGFERDPSD